MAYNAVSTTKNAIAAMRYGEHEESVIRGGVDCPPDTENACRLFKADRVMWNKDSGIQAHILIQSFKGDECTPEEANRIGQELAKRVAPGHRAMVYTHQEAKGGNIHNHIVISAVNHENGKKLDGHGILYKSRNESNEICKEHGLSIIQEKKAELRYTMAEQGIIDKGGRSWKNDIREAVEDGMKQCRSLDEFKAHLKEYGITIHERGSKQTDSGKQWTYCTQHEGKEVKVRAAKLGEAYTLESVGRALGREKVSALERVQEMQKAGKSALDKANALINGKVQQEQERQRQLEAQRTAEVARQKAAEEKKREQARAAEQAKKPERTRQTIKTKTKTAKTSRGFGR